MSNPTVLYDGWPLVYEPYSPAAMHLQTLFAYLPEQIEAIVALPGPGPTWLGNMRTYLRHTPASDSGQLLWEQRLLPQIAQEVGAPILHRTSLGAPLLGKVIRVISPGYFEGESLIGQRSKPVLRKSGEGRSLAARLRLSLGQGGMARARAIFWPGDVPDPNLPIPLIKLPPLVHPSFTWEQDQPVRSELRAGGQNGRPRVELESDAGPRTERVTELLASHGLPESYVLYQGPSNLLWLQRLLESWQWASGPIGDWFPLVILGIPEKRLEELQILIERFELGETVLALPDISVEALPAVYLGCSAYFHPAPISPWGGPVRNALACGKPVVAAESHLADAIVGPAAYLAPVEDPRALGAALLTVVVEEDVANELAQSARQRSQDWHNPAFGQDLGEAYHQILS